MAKRKLARKTFSLFFSFILVFSMFFPSLSFAQSNGSSSTTVEEVQLEKQREQEFKNESTSLQTVDSETSELPNLLKGLGIEAPEFSEEQDRTKAISKQKVEEKVIQQLKNEDRVDVIIRLKERPEVNDIYPKIKGLEKRSEKIKELKNHLEQKANASQKGLNLALAALEKQDKVKKKESFWIINGISASITKDALEELKQRADIESITLDETLQLPEITVEDSTPRLPEWGIEKINATKVWGEYGIKGEGIVVGIMDSGVDGGHEALKHNYRGKDGNHQYSWIDLSGHNYPTPQDGNGHGTHVAGTAVGGGQGEPIGVAPEAEWIAAKIFNDGGSTTTSAIHRAFEWFMAPGGDPSKAPHVVNNSWGNSNAYNIEFYEDVEAWVAAGIFPLFAAGNDGPGSQTIGSPGSFPSAFAIGATDENDQIAYFSSRGPVFWDDGNGNQTRLIKPDVSAPGHYIYSAWPSKRNEGKYNTISGTSMATPHVAGAIALLYQANPDLTIDEVKNLLKNTARKETYMGTLPNDIYGNGIVNIYQAVTEAAFAGELTGSLKNADGQAIAGTVTFVKDGSTHEIGEDGEVNLSIREGTHKVLIESFGYLTKEETVTIKKGENTTVQWKLDPAQTYRLSGRVVDSETKDGIAFAYIRVNDTPLKAVRTDQNGTFNLEKVPAGTYKLQVSGEGIKSNSTEVTVEKEEEIVISVSKISSSSNLDWKMANNNLNRNAVSPVAIDIEGLEPGWSFDNSSYGQILFSTPAVAEQRVVFVTDRGWVVSLDSETGVEQWSVRLGSSNRSSPTIEEGVVYLSGGADKRIYALDLDNGRVLWNYETGSLPIYESPLYYEGKVIVTSGLDENASLTVLNSKTGEKLWSKPLGASTYLGASFGEGHVFVGSYENKTLRALQMEDGSELWTVKLEAAEGISTQPVYQDGNLYVVGSNFDSGDGTLYSFNASNGELNWKAPGIGVTQAGTAIVYEDLVIVGSSTVPALKAFDKETGAMIWQNKTVGTSLNSGTVTANGILFVTGSNGGFFALDVFTGQSLKDFTLPDYSTSGIPVTAGKVFVTYGTGIQIYQSLGILKGTVTDTNGSPIEATVSVDESGVTTQTAENGSYELLHKPGEYRVKVSKYGKKQVIEDITFVSGYEQSKNYILEDAETGSVKVTVVNKRTKQPLEGVSVSFTSTPVSGTTNAEGVFVQDDVYEGAYQVEVSLNGFVLGKQQVEILKNQENTFSFDMQPIDIAVLNDWNSEVTKLLQTNDFHAEERGWDIIDDLERYQVIYLNGAYGSGGKQPTEAEFTQLVEKAKAHDVNLVFVDQWGSGYGSIEHLKNYYQDPKEVSHHYDNGTVRMQVDVEHPIFEGYQKGDRLTLYQRTGDFAWFKDYSGRSLGTIGDTTIGFVGTGVAYNAVSENSAHLLLASHGAAPWVSPLQGWLPDHQQILFNGLNYLMNSDFGKATGTITNGAGETVNAQLEVLETGVKTISASDGSFEIFHDEGTYTLEIRATGYETQTVEVSFTHGEPNELQITMGANGGGVVAGTVTDATSNSAVGGALVKVVDENETVISETTTGSNGRFEVKDLEDKVYTLQTTKDGYIVDTQIFDVAKLSGDINVVLYQVPRVAVVGDYYSAANNFTSIFTNLGVEVTSLTVSNLADRMSEFDVVFYNNGTATKEVFERILTTADASQTSIIFGDSYWNNSINQLVNHRADPKVRNIVRNTSSSAGYVVLEENPIFQGADIGEFIELMTPSSSRVGYFNDYSGYPLAEIKHEGGESLGLGIAYKPRTSGSVEVLMSGHSFDYDHDASDYTDKGKELLIQTVLWASNAKFNTIKGTIVDVEGNPIKADIKVKGKNFSTTSNSESGEFSIAILDGNYEIEVSSYGYKSQVVPVIVNASADNYTIQLDVVDNAVSISGVIENKQDTNIIEGAHIEVLGVPREAYTDAQGRYSIKNLLPGTYTLRVQKDGFVRKDIEVEVSPSEQLKLDEQLNPSPTIGVTKDLNTSGVTVKQYLEERGYIVQNMTFKDIELLDELDLVFVNSDYDNAQIPTSQEFAAFQKALDETRTPVIWTGQDGGRGGIRFLNQYTNDPSVIIAGDDAGAKGKVLAEHPITAGIDIGTEFNIPARFDYYYGFDGYSGESIVEFNHEANGEKGSMVAYKGRTTDSVEILLANMTFSHVYNPALPSFDSTRETILNNAIEWALYNTEPLVGEIHGTVKNNLGTNVAGTVIVKETGKTYETDDQGNFFIALEEGTYELSFNAFGHHEKTVSVSVENGEQLTQIFEITADDVGTITGKVINSETNEPIEEASFEIRGTPLKGKTDNKGEFKVTVPAGVYDIRIIAPGYAPMNKEGITVSIGENTDVSFMMKVSQKIAVVTSSLNKDRLVPFIQQYGFDVDHYLNTNHAALYENMENYRLIIFNDSSMTDEQFKNFVEHANELQVSMIFPGQWGNGTIKELSDVFGDPKTVTSTFKDNRINLKVQQDHPIFKGFTVGDELLLLSREGSSTQYNVYKDYSGTTIGELTHDTSGVLGDGIGFKYTSSNSVHVLLSGLHAGSYGHPADRWTDAAKQIYVNAIEFALTASQGEVFGTVTDEEGKPVENAKLSIVDTGLSTTTNADGQYRIGLGNGQYKVKVQARGYMEQTKDVVIESIGDSKEISFQLEKIQGITLSGIVTNADNEEVITDAKVVLTPEDPQGFVDELTTDENGTYTFKDLLPGNYQLSITINGYLPVTEEVVIAEEDVIANLSLHPYQVAVIGDVKTELTTFLNSQELYAEERSWDVTEEVGKYRLILVNTNKATNEQVEKLIEESDKHQVSVIFTGTWGEKEGSISLLRQVYKNPEVDQHGYNEDEVFVNGIEGHPIFEGFETPSAIRILAEKSPYATFKGYTGVPLAGLSVGEEQKGNSIAYEFRSKAHMHLLLSSFAVTNMVGPTYGWTEDGKKLFRNALLWAMDAEQEAPTSVSWDEKEVKVKDPNVTLSGKADPGTTIQIISSNKKKDKVLGTTKTNSDGTFVVEMELTNGSYQLTAQAINFAGQVETEHSLHVVVSGKPKSNVNSNETKVEVVNGEVNLSWTDIEANSFEILRDGEKMVEQVETNYIDENVARGTTYTYQIKAIAEDGSVVEFVPVSITVK
ncbi:carboxypeptidase regulatory-like domain-containing protein [Fredinandcohnia sp. 179-A 10B2 NHS]|uniref:carboxypeptidase regulatory-like domain-containing protein n=1 Tax=Fredinandcohnia sp. 179-A 10B2 NHS TaxID=3235176 RepID=UPI0039A0754E